MTSLKILAERHEKATFMNAHLGYLGDQHAQRLVPAEPIVRLEGLEGLPRPRTASP